MPLPRRARLTALLAATAALTAGAARAQHAPHWSYEGEGAPDRWGALDDQFRTCAIGGQQSPVDLAQPIAARIAAPALAWRDETGSIVNNGHTIQVNMPGASALAGADGAFKLAQFHFHTPSEHAIGGARTDMEVHFVHTGPDGRIKVVGVMLRAGRANAEFARLMAAAATANAGGTPLAVSPKALLPRHREVFQYEGSLTTPPCSEVVDWTVYRAPVEVAAADIARFRALFPENARPLQPVNRRYVLQSAK